MPSAQNAPTDPLLLLADDEPCVRDVLAHFAARLGWRVQTAADGPALLALAARAPRAAAILLDARMPGPGPEALLRALRVSHPHAQLVVMSGDPARMAGTLADARLTKPFSPVQLEAALQAPLLAEAA